MKRVRHIPHYTYEDYKTWKGDWQLFDGVPFAGDFSMDADHQNIQENLTDQINDELKKHACQDKFFVNKGVDWLVDENTVFQSDIALVGGDAVSDTIRTVPTMLVEIISKSTAYIDSIIKKEICETSGVRYYLIVNPQNRMVDIFELVNGEYVQVLINEFEVDQSCKVQLMFSEIWDR